MRITAADPITYTYRDDVRKLHIMRRPSYMGDAADNNADWIAGIRTTRCRLGYRKGRAQWAAPVYENLTAYGKPIRRPGRFTSRASEIATILAALCDNRNPDELGRECYIAD
jgi:hypothetical protein